ncbi:uncharacterized protein LOC122402637 isoform X2 [Colletes gigas]|uniref:uncharacterized protein LOC122402637 isoform X2 n=1 Tax=Colletes gigas TaxID=935657 RepID=UPI001C9B5827|nr:uncharacterized protein LOC122402637 isoform X2 [Colletes gigas]
MTQWMSFVLLVVAMTIVATESRAIPAEPMFLREKRTAVHPYPHRAMMFTGYYRPVRRSGHDGQATGVFAQGNAVSGEAAFFGGMQTPHLRNGPEPIEEQEVSSAEAQAAPAAPAPEESYGQDNQTPLQQDHGYQLNENHPQSGQYPQEEPHYPQEEHHHSDEDQNHHKQGGLPPQEQPEAQPAPSLTTEATLLNPPNAEAPGNRPKVNRGKKTKKPPVVVEEDDDDDNDEDEEDDDDEPTVPFVPFKGNRRRQNYPNLNNYFPMVFSFPGVSTRAGSSGSPPGAVTAIANSYSTGKGGVASSVATAYGGSPNGKKKRPQVSED